MASKTVQQPTNPQEQLRLEFLDLSASASQLCALVEVLHEMTSDIGRQTQSELDRYAWLQLTARDHAQDLVRKVDCAESVRRCTAL